MQGKDWGILLRRIPTSYHEGLTLATITGAEVVLQAIVRIEPDFVILRGRAAGTNDAGKIIVLPFHHINYISFKKTLTEPEVAALFGETDRNFAALPESLAKAAEKPADNNGNRQGLDPKLLPNRPPEDPKDKNGNKASKSILLARIRERLNNDSSKPHR